LQLQDFRHAQNFQDANDDTSEMRTTARATANLTVRQLTLALAAGPG